MSGIYLGLNMFLSIIVLVPLLGELVDIVTEKYFEEFGPF